MRVSSIEIWTVIRGRPSINERSPEMRRRVQMRGPRSGEPVETRLAYVPRAERQSRGIAALLNILLTKHICRYYWL
jgi:hypothetical protein